MKPSIIGRIEPEAFEQARSAQAIAQAYESVKECIGQILPVHAVLIHLAGYAAVTELVGIHVLRGGFVGREG